MNLNEQMKHQSPIKITYFIVFLLAIHIIVTVLPFTTIGITTGDELEFFLTSKYRTYFGNSKIYARDTGRFYFLITFPLYAFSFFIKNILVLKTINVITIVLNYILAAIIIKRTTTSKELAYIFLLIAFSTFQATSPYNPNLGYPLFFTSSLLIAETAALLVITFHNKFLYLWFSALLLFITFLFHELYFMFVILILLGLFFIEYKNLIKGKMRPYLRKISPFIFSSLTYLIIYWVYKSQHPSKYSGTKVVDSISVGQIFSTAIALVEGAIPLSSYGRSQNRLKQFSDLAIEYENNIYNVLAQLQFIWIIKAICVIFILYYFIILLHKKINFSLIIKFLIFGILVTILPQLPLGLTDKYTRLTNGGMWTYITTYYSHFGITIILTSLIIFFLYPFRNNKKIVIAITIIFAVALSVVSVLTDYTNNKIIANLNQTKFKFALVDEFLKSEEYKNLPSGTPIFTPDLWTNHSAIGRSITEQGGFKWHSYFLAQSKIKHFTFRKKEALIEKLEKNDNPLYFIGFKQAAKNTNQYLTLARANEASIINDSVVSLTSDTVYLYVYSSYTKYAVFVSTRQNDANMSVNGNIIDNCNDYCWLYLHVNKPVEKIFPLVITGKNIILDELMLSTIINEDEDFIRIE